MDDAILLRYFDALQPRREPSRDVLLHNTLAADAGRVALHGDWSAADMRQHNRGDGLVVRSHFALRNAILREQYLLRVRDHGASLKTSRAALSMRTPSNRGCRSLPCTVHSMNATCTTISGRTQCARFGRLVAFVNGGAGISRASSRSRRSSSSLVSKPVPTFPA